MNPEITKVTNEFVAALEAAIDEGVAARLRHLVTLVPGGTALRVPAFPRTPSQAAAFNDFVPPSFTSTGVRAVLKAPPKKKRRKAPIQLCPAPGCTGRAAPSLSMLCANHKNADPAKVWGWREARRARKGRAA